MRKKLHIALVGILCTSFVAVSSSVSPVRALSYPTMRTFFPKCSTSSDEFCIETFEFTNSGGNKVTPTEPSIDLMTDPNALIGRTDPYINVFLSTSYSGPSSVVGAMPAGMAINYYDPIGSMIPLGSNPTTLPGLQTGTYRTVIRTGDYDPSIMLLNGKYESYSVVKGADGFFTMDLTIRPTPIAKVVIMNGDQTALNSCKANKWLSNCEANQAYEQYALASFGMLPEEGMRNSTRGTWVSTNASELSFSPAGFLSGNFDVDAQGPHFVPTDFPTTGLTAEGTRYVNPAYFEMSVPYSMVAYVLSQKIGKSITVDQVQAFLDKPTDVLEGTIEEAASASSAVVEKVQTLGIQKGETGVRVNFNLSHFSAPNPTLKFKDPNASTGTNAGTSTGTTKVTKKLGNGASVTPATSAKKGQKISGKNLVKPSAGAKVSKVTTKSKAICSVSGTSIKMLKVGSCKLSVAVLYKKKTSTVSVTIPVT